jgi:hypothetical protein
MSEARIASEGGTHWYDREGNPVYTVPCKSKNAKSEFRPTNITDARKLDLVPSFTLIKDQISKPGLEVWKLNQMLAAALTLPRLDNEPPDDFARRVINDYKEEGRRAAERGKDLHAAIEDYVRGQSSLLYQKHCEKVREALLQPPYLIDISSGDWRTEHSFASELGYGGKTDLAYDSGVIIDVKTKERIDDKKQLVWDEHPMQCAAYGYGIFNPKFRGLNVFIGVDDCEVRVFEHTWEDLSRGWEMFKALLRYWQIKNDWKT